MCASCEGGPRERPLAQFGVDRARPDGRNVRCKTCVARRMAERRLAKKEGRPTSTRPRVARRPAAESFVRGERLEFAPLVLGAIDQAGGICSQAQIINFAGARLPPRVPLHVIEDQVERALGDLFTERRIATRGEAEERVYFRRGSFVFRS